MFQWAETVRSRPFAHSKILKEKYTLGLTSSNLMAHVVAFYSPMKCNLVSHTVLNPHRQTTILMSCSKACKHQMSSNQDMLLEETFSTGQKQY